MKEIKKESITTIARTTGKPDDMSDEEYDEIMTRSMEEHEERELAEQAEETWRMTGKYPTEWSHIAAPYGYED